MPMRKPCHWLGAPTPWTHGSLPRACVGRADHDLRLKTPRETGVTASRNLWTWRSTSGSEFHFTTSPMRRMVLLHLLRCMYETESRLSHPFLDALRFHVEHDVRTLWPRSDEKCTL